MHQMIKKIFLIAELEYGQAGRSFKQTFEKLWHQVVAYESMVYPFPQTKRVGVWSKIAAWLNLIWSIIRINLFFPRASIRTCRPDMVLIFKWTILLPQTVQKIKRLIWPDAELVNRNPDNPFADYNTSMRYLQSIKYYDEHITFAKHLKTTLETVWAKKATWIPFWYDPVLMPEEWVIITEEDKQKYACEVLFVGTRDEKREEVLGRICERYVVKIFGNNRDRCTNGRVRHCVVWRAIYGKEFVKAVKIAKINLNILRTQNKYSHNMRNIEIPGCGGVLLTERSQEAQDLTWRFWWIYFRKDIPELLNQIEKIKTWNINQKDTQEFVREYTLENMLHGYLHGQYSKDA